MSRRLPPGVSFAILVFIWGTTWLAIKIGYDGLDPVWGASLRFFLASLIFLPIVLGRGRRFPTKPRELLIVAYVGLAMFGLDYGLLYWGEQFVSSGLTAILFGTMPLFIALFSSFAIPHERVTARQLVGILIGFAGLLLIFGDELRIGSEAAGPMVGMVAAAAAAASTSIIVRRWGQGIASDALSGGAMLVGAVALLVASLLLGETPSLPRTGVAWGSLLYLVVFGSVASFILYWRLLAIWPASRAGLVPLLTPVVAVATGLLAGEHLTATQWVGSFVVLAGVSLAMLPKILSRGAPIAPAPGK